MVEYEYMSDVDLSVANALCKSEEDHEGLLAALERSREPLDNHTIPVYQEDYQLVCYWYALAKFHKRQANGNKQEYQLYEEWLEAAVKGMASRLIMSAHLNKMGGLSA